MASCTICRTARNAHSAPLLNLLKLEPLQKRRVDHIKDLAKSFLSGEFHPSFRGYFELLEDDTVGSGCKATTVAGKKTSQDI